METDLEKLENGRSEGFFSFFQGLFGCVIVKRILIDLAKATVRFSVPNIVCSCWGPATRTLGALESKFEIHKKIWHHKTVNLNECGSSWFWLSDTENFFLNCWAAPLFQLLMFTQALGRFRSLKMAVDITELVFLTPSFPSGFAEAWDQTHTLSSEEDRNQVPGASSSAARQAFYSTARYSCWY